MDGSPVCSSWAGDFQQVTWVTLVVLGLLTAISFVIDLVATAAGAKRVGATKLAVVGAAVGTLGGLFLGLPGLILGPFVGAVVGEFVGSDRGLGFLINVGRGQYDTALVFVALFTLIAMALALYGTVVLVERKLLAWQQ